MTGERAAIFFRSYRLPLAILASNAVALGFSRFTYDALLPQMRDGLGATSSTMALVASVNMAGYIAGSAASGMLLRRVRADRLLVACMVACAASFAAYAVVPATAFVIAIAVVPGAAGALILVAGIGIIGRTVSVYRRGISFGIATAGIGLGSFVGAVVASSVGGLSDGWRIAWLLVAGLTLGILAAIVGTVRRAVAELPVRPSAPQRSAVPAGEPTPRDRHQASERLGGRSVVARPAFRAGRAWVFPIYMSWGLAMVLYSTFFTTFLFDERGVAPTRGAAIYSLVGLATFVGGLAVGPLSDRVGRRRMLVATLASGGVAIALVLTVDHVVGYLVSVLLFGLPISGVGTLVQAFISDHWLADEVGPVFGRATVAFGVSIVFGPMIAALLVGATGSFRAAYLLAMLSAGVGLAFIRMLPSRPYPARAL